MSELCKIPKCTRPSCALCNCCEKNICQWHINEHSKSLLGQLDPLVDEINTLGNELVLFDKQITYMESREKLELWRMECHQKIELLFEKKCQELEQCSLKKIVTQTEKIDFIRSKLARLIRLKAAARQDVNFLTSSVSQLRQEMHNLQHTYVQMQSPPLAIRDSMITITDTIRPKIDLTTLPPPHKIINHLNKTFTVLTSNNSFLLMHQGSKLCLVDQYLNVVKETAWLNNITDMCWSATLNQFILFNDSDLFRVDEDIAVIKKIPIQRNDKWSACTCSDTSLFLVSNELGSTVSEFALSPTIEFVQQWKSPVTCKNNEQIDSVAYNNGTLALLIKNLPKKSVRMELRFAATLDHLWSLPLDIKCSKKIVSHCCLLSFDEWLVADYEKGCLLHVTKSGQVKATIKYNVIPYRLHLFNQNILVIWTKNSKIFHQLV